MNANILLPFTTIPLNSPINGFPIPPYYVVKKDIIRDIVEQHMTKLHVDMIDICYGTTQWNRHAFYEQTLEALELITLNRGLWPELPYKSNKRRSAIIHHFGMPSVDHISFAGTIISSVILHCKYYEVSKAKALPGIHGFKIIDGNIKSNQVIPQLHINGVRNCTMYLINRKDKMLNNYTETMGLETYKNLCNTYSKIVHVMKIHMLEIVECVLMVGGYLK